MQFNVVFAVWLCLDPVIFLLSAGCSYTSISTRQHQVIFQYTQTYRSEKDLPICNEKSVCNILYKRFFLPAVAERLCRCPTNEECPWKWTEPSDNYTMILNNRSQLKFCSWVHQLPKCESQSTALTTEKSIKDSEESFGVTVSCFCPPGSYWKHFRTYERIISSNSSSVYRDEFKCSKLKRCLSFDVCGFVRPDHKSIFYICSCPIRHFCVYKDKTSVNMNLLMYEGPVYKAICEPNDDYDY